MNIPAPGASTDYSNYGYAGGSIRQGFAAEGGDSDMGAYKAQLQAYYQNISQVYQSLQAGDPRRAQCQQYMQMAQEYAQEVGMQLQGGGIQNQYDLSGGASGATGPSFPVDSQDPNHIVTVDGPSTQIQVNSSDPDKRTIDVYQKTNDLGIPSNAASVSVVAMPDDAVAGKTMYEVTITFPNGTTRKVKYHNIERTDFKLNVHTPDISQVTIDPACTKASAKEMGAASTAQSGTPPDKTDATTRTWNKHDSVDYAVTKGVEEDKIYADDVNITLEDRGQTADVTKLGAHEYLVKIYDDATPPALVRTVHLYQVDTVNIDGVDQENIKFKDISKTPPDAAFKAWSDPTHSADSQLSIGGGSSSPTTGEAPNVNHPEDTAPDSMSPDGATAIYNNSSTVDIHADSTDTVKTHDITCPGDVTIHGASFNDKMEVTYLAGPPREWTVKVYRDGIQDAAHTETFYIKGGANTKIKLDVMDPSSLITNGKSDVSLGAESTAASVSLVGGAGTAGETDAPVPAMVTALKAAIPGLTDELLLQKIAERFSITGEEGGLTMAELQTAITNGEFPPAVPNLDMINFVKDISPVFRNAVNAATPWHGPTLLALHNTSSTELIKVLKAIYPSATIEKATPGTTTWTQANDIKFNGSGFNYTSETQNHTHEVSFSWY